MPHLQILLLQLLKPKLQSSPYGPISQNELLGPRKEAGRKGTTRKQPGSEEAAAVFLSLCLHVGYAKEKLDGEPENELNERGKQEKGTEPQAAVECDK